MRSPQVRTFLAALQAALPDPLPDQVDAARLIAEAGDHLDERAAELMAAGLAPHEAAAQAIAQFGSPAEVARALTEPAPLAQFRNPLHVRCGDDILQSLRDAGLPGTMMKWCDVLCLGPTPAGLTHDRWQATRAQFLAAFADQTPEATREELDRQDAALARYVDHDAVIFWFEHDLFDQSILFYLLHWFAERGADRARLHMVTTDNFPGHERFIGLGNLNSAELAVLARTVQPVTADQVRLGQTLWRAWQDPRPLALEALLSADLSALPYARGVVQRHLEDLPWTSDGLGRTDRAALAAVASGAARAMDAFAAVQASEERPWMGDAMLYAVLERLRHVPHPLVVSASDQTVGHDTRLELTDTARAILDGTVDAARINPPDVWVGGVHVTPANPWRWDADRRLVRLVPA